MSQQTRITEIARIKTRLQQLRQEPDQLHITYVDGMVVGEVNRLNAITEESAFLRDQLRALEADPNDLNAITY